MYVQYKFNTLLKSFTKKHYHEKVCDSFLPNQRFDF